MPVNPVPKPTRADQAKRSADQIRRLFAANRGRAALALAMLAGATAAGDAPLVGVALAAAAGLVLPPK